MNRRDGRDTQHNPSRDPLRDPSRDASRDSWRAAVQVGQIPDTGLHRDIEADAATRAAMAKVASVRDIVSARASFDLRPRSGGRVDVAGRVQARVGQNCVVTLDPIENDIDEAVDLMFAPAEPGGAVAGPSDNEGGDRPIDVADAPEPIENGLIDLGRLATDVIFLAIDPYPRKAGAVFEPEVEPVDPEDHPFAALKSLKRGPGATEGEP